jgi:hypothetical protein
VGLAVCGYMDRLPQNWADFLGGSSNGVFVVADPETKRRLSSEQVRYALGVLRHDPIGLARALASDAFGQVPRFSLSDLEVSADARENYNAIFPAKVSAEIDRSMAGRSSSLLRAISSISYAVVLLSLATLAVFGFSSRIRGSLSPRYWEAASICVGGVLLNGLICGVLASPYDRFQSRVIWLVPFVALVGLMLLRPNPDPRERAH